MHEDFLMKMFMDSLEENARSWYEGLPSESLFSLTDFHTVFHEHYKNQYPSLLLVQDCVHVLKVSLNIWKTYIMMMSLWMNRF